MKNNLWVGDKKPDDAIIEFHEESNKNFKLPLWMIDLECPFCNEKFSWRCIRGINFKFNARNHGDFCIEFLCDNCSVGDIFYFRKAFESVEDILDIVGGNTQLTTKPVVEEDMYKQMYNNLFEKMMDQQLSQDPTETV